MEFLPLIVSVTLLNLFAAISPGPDFLMCVKNAVTYSRKAGAYTGVGIALGLMVHIIYCSAGIGLLISQSVMAFNIVKFAGAAYLIYIGIKSIIAHKTDLNFDNNTETKALSPSQAIKTGFLTNVLNPKATLFFLALFTMVLSPTTPFWVLSIIFIIIILTALIWFSIVAALFSHTLVRQRYVRNQRIINSVFGILLIALGLKVALSGLF